MSDADSRRQPEARGRHPRNALSDAFVRTVAKPGRYCDGHGLYLDVRPSGTRSWVQRLSIRGRRRELGLGSFPLVSLDDARARAFDNRRLAPRGGDPLGEKRRAEGAEPSPRRPRRCDADQARLAQPEVRAATGGRAWRGSPFRAWAGRGCRR